MRIGCQYIGMEVSPIRDQQLLQSMEFSALRLDRRPSCDAFVYSPDLEHLLYLGRLSRSTRLFRIPPPLGVVWSVNPLRLSELYAEWVMDVAKPN